jgi:Ni/Co efflux regulator RcnB
MQLLAAKIEIIGYYVPGDFLSMKKFAITMLAMTFLAGTVATAAFAQDNADKKTQKKGKKKKNRKNADDKK